jgi:hypothetical protein
MFYLIDRGRVTQKSVDKFPVAESPALFWVEAADDAGAVGDYYSNGQFQTPEQKMTLAEKREVCLKRLKDIKQNMQFKGVIYNGNRYFSDDDSYYRLCSTIVVADHNSGAPFPLIWRLADGTLINVTLLQTVAITKLMAQRREACVANAITLTNVIMNSPDPFGVDLNTGWPA